MVKILAFDTETSDRAPYIPGTTTWVNSKKLLSIKNLKKKKSMWSTLLTKWPSIIQLAYILYDTDNPSTKTKIFNKYIDIEEDVKISEESLAIHHISHQKMESKDRVKIEDALTEFLKDVKEADTIVGHNVAFDRKMIVAELLRLTKNSEDSDIIEMMTDKKFKCTQEITRPMCKLENRNTNTNGQNKKGYYKFKTPKLIEAYEHFFGCVPKQELLHDALIDAIICLRVYCFVSMNNKSFDKKPFDKKSFDKKPFDNKPFDINHTNKTITSYIKKITPTRCANKSITKKKGILKTRKTMKTR
jgi:DNA polymerase-3 subunit epsilon